MQKKKYFFSLAVFVVMLVGVFGGGMEVKAAKCCYSSNQCHRSGVGYCLDAIIGGCPKCTDTTRGTDEGCCDGTIVTCSGNQTDGSCGLNATEKWCCETGCVDIYPGGTCASGSPTEKPCNQISKCGGTKGGCCVDDSKTPKECPGVPDADGKCAVGNRQDNECSFYCTTASPSPTPSPVDDGTSSTSASFVNPLKFNTIEGVLTGLLGALKGFVITLAIIFIVLGGILYMMSAGDPAMLKRAKDCWLSAVIGLAIVIAAPTFLAQVQEIMGGDLTGTEGAPTIKDIATRVLSMLLSIVGIIAIISLVIAGSMYMTAYGDEKRIETAKKMGTYAIIGIIVALGSLVAVEQIKILITG